MDSEELPEQPEQAAREPRRPMAAYALVAVAAFVLSQLLNWGYTTYAINSSTNARQAQATLFEARLCHSLNSLGALTPPPASSTADSGPDSSRGYLLKQHILLGQLSPDVGCKR